MYRYYVQCLQLHNFDLNLAGFAQRALMCVYYSKSINDRYTRHYVNFLTLGEVRFAVLDGKYI